MLLLSPFPFDEWALIFCFFLFFFFAEQSLLWFCNSIIRWNQPSPELNNMFQTLLQGFKQHDEAGWAAQVATFPPIIQERLAARYGV